MLSASGVASAVRELDQEHNVSDIVNDDAFQCPVCLVEEEDGVDFEIVATTCGHLFCMTCLAKLSDARLCCAMCRAPLVKKIDASSTEAKTNATVSSLTSISASLVHRPLYHLHITEKLFNSYRLYVDVDGRSHAISIHRGEYDITCHNGNMSVIYERHVSLPMAGTEQVPAYISSLIEGAHQITYSTTRRVRKSTSATICERMTRIRRQYHNNSHLFLNQELPPLRWINYRFMDFVNCVYSMQVPEESV